MSTPLQIFGRATPRMITPNNDFEISRLEKINGLYKITSDTLNKFINTNWVKRHLLSIEIIDHSQDLAGKFLIKIAHTEHCSNLLIEIEKGYVWNTIKKSIDLKATRNFYIQFVRPANYHFYGQNDTNVVILPNKIVKKIFEMNDSRFDDIKDQMQMIILKAEKVRDDWILMNLED